MKIKINTFLNFILFISILSFLSFAVWSCSGTNNQYEKLDNNDVSLSEDQKHFNIGERSEYELTALIGHIANQTIEVLDIVEYQTDSYNEEYNGRRCYYVLSETRTLPSVEKVYKIDSKIYSYIDYETLLPIKIKKETVETNYEDIVEIYFDQNNKKGVYKSHRKLDQFPDGIDFEWENEGGLLYLVSAIFYIRGQKLAINDEFTINIFDEKALSPLENKLVVERGEPYKGRIGSIEVSQANEESEKINSISMRVIDYKGINWLPVDIRIGFFKLGDRVIKMEGALSFYKSSNSDEGFGNNSDDEENASATTDNSSVNNNHPSSNTVNN